MNIPITFHNYLAEFSEKTRPFVMKEFAANGAKHLIISDQLFLQLMQDSTLAKKLMHEMAQEGLSFVDSHAPSGRLLDLNCPDLSFRSEMINRHKIVLNIAASMGVKTVTIHCGLDFVTKEVPLETHVARTKEALEKLLDEAEKCGVIIAIENIWTPNCHPDVLLDIKKDFPTDYLGFCYDSGHANLIDKNHVNCFNQTQNDWIKILNLPEVKWEDRALEKMLPHVVSCHLHDNDGSCDQHRLIGTGNIDWKHIKKLLMQAPRLQCIQSEMANDSIREICEAMKFFEAL
ncbi:MAG: sugar phosphate isomerase/epimerase [Lentisphaeria bacterium]|nr:sugar phosphate isomerase/epimerase [Lentisphaeria bacterium]